MSAPKKYYIDTNIFLRVLIKEDEKIFKDCVQFLEAVKQKRVNAFTSSLVIAEIGWTLLRLYKLPKEEATQKIKSIVNLKNLKIENSCSLPQALDFYASANIKFIDALIAAHPLVLTGQAAVVSYDRDFDKIKIPRLEPGQMN